MRRVHRGHGACSSSGVEVRAFVACLFQVARFDVTPRGRAGAVAWWMRCILVLALPLGAGRGHKEGIVGSHESKTS